jgi:hypothetical protein
MFLRVRALLGTAALILLLTPAAALGREHKSPTPAQIRTAVSRAEHSRDLWATVNICHAPRFGIRGQMPALGFATHMSMKIQVEYWSVKRKRYRKLRGVNATLSLGRIAHDLHQAGTIWTFGSPVNLSGKVTFEWHYENKVIGRVTKVTRHRRRGVDFSDPPRYSKASCSF